jgi:hypothetical protein
MDIECKLHREGGTKVTLGNIEYHFTPQPDGAHVAAVEVEDHIDRFLSISEAYKMYRGVASSAAPIVAQQEQQAAPTFVVAVSASHPPTFKIGETTYTAEQIASIAIEKAGITTEEWNALTDDERGEEFDVTLDALAAADADKNGDGVVDEAEERAALAAKYEAKHGKKPQWNMNIDKLRAAVAE